MTIQIDPPPTLAQVAHVLWSRPGLVVLDLGARWTLVTWAGGPSVSAWAPTDRRWLREARRLLRPPQPEHDAPFSGGLVGWLGYEAGAAFERLPSPKSPPSAPSVALWRADGGLLLDRASGRWRITGAPSFAEQAQQALTQAQRAPEPPPLTPSDLAWAELDRPEVQARYEAGVRAVLEHIRAGDVYQVNLAWEERDLPVPDPLAAWLLLRAMNPARRGALMRWGDTTLLSNSPELYLRVRRRGDRLVATSLPIKGTADARQGEAALARLERSEKERAELTMIVDLVRNDLGRVARRVRVGPRAVVRCGDLWHAEQRVSALLRRDRDALDAVAASFPPGSVTGAPKIEAMGVIHALEAGPRGVYTGAMGFFGDDGEAHLNVAIRTATVADGLARFHVGAGLVADSDPDSEWRETLAKGRALVRGLLAR